jgi:hypothetical protein
MWEYNAQTILYVFFTSIKDGAGRGRGEGEGDGQELKFLFAKKMAKRR